MVLYCSTMMGLNFSHTSSGIRGALGRVPMMKVAMVCLGEAELQKKPTRWRGVTLCSYTSQGHAMVWGSVLMPNGQTAPLDGTRTLAKACKCAYEASGCLPPI